MIQTIIIQNALAHNSKFLLWQAAQPITKLNISIPMKVKSILTLNSSTISPYPRPHSSNRRKKRFLGIVFKQAKSVTIHQ